MSEIRFETAIGTLEVWLGSGGELRVFLLDEDGKSVRMLGTVVGDKAELAAVFERLGLIDREATFYAHEIWSRVSPTPEPGLERRRKEWGEEDLPAPIWNGGP